MGNRFKGGIAPGAMPPLHRYLGTPVLSFIGRLFFRSSIGDFNCGLRGFRRDSAIALGLQATGMEFASEMIVQAALAKQKISEVPTTLAKDGRSRPPHLRSWRDGWRHLRFLLLFSPRWLFFIPGLVLLVLGLGLGAAVATGPLTIGGVSLDVDTLVACGAMVDIGFQAVLFWLFTQVYAGAEGFLPTEPKVQTLLGKLSLERGAAGRRRGGPRGPCRPDLLADLLAGPRLRSPELRARAAPDGPVGDRAGAVLPDHPRHVLPVDPWHQADAARPGRREGGAQCQRRALFSWPSDQVKPCGYGKRRGLADHATARRL